MNKTLLDTLNQTALAILRPLARTMIRNGVSCGNFEALVRKAYVDEAFRMGANNTHAKTTVSSVSAQTGLSRKEVKRLKELSEIDAGQNDQKYNRATRVISGWTNHPDFIDEQGQALPLTLNGDPENSAPKFADLVKHFSGDITAKAMLDLLLHSDTVELNGQMVKLIKPAYVPSNDSSEIALILGTDTAELIETISHNMTTESHEKRFQRKVSTHKLDPKFLHAFKRRCENQAQNLLEELDQWLSEHETDDPKEAQYVSLGIYYYQPETEGKSNEQ